MLNTSRVKAEQEALENKFKKIFSIAKTFLSNRENVVLILLVLISVCLFKIAFYGIAVNGDVTIDGSVGTSTTVDGSINVSTY